MFKIKEDVDLTDICRNFSEDNTKYYLSTSMDEWIEIDKNTRLIWQSGYNGLIYDWAKRGLIEDTSID